MSGTPDVVPYRRLGWVQPAFRRLDEKASIACPSSSKSIRDRGTFVSSVFAFTGVQPGSSRPSSPTDSRIAACVAWTIRWFLDLLDGVLG
jgi:hypothetical protein